MGRKCGQRQSKSEAFAEFSEDDPSTSLYSAAYRGCHTCRTRQVYTSAYSSCQWLFWNRQAASCHVPLSATMVDTPHDIRQHLIVMSTSRLFMNPALNQWCGGPRQFANPYNSTPLKSDGYSISTVSDNMWSGAWYIHTSHLSRRSLQRGCRTSSIILVLLSSEERVGRVWNASTICEEPLTLATGSEALMVRSIGGSPCS